MDEEDDDWELSDLVEQLVGRRDRCFRRTFVDSDEPLYWERVPKEDTYTEWQLRLDAEEILDVLDESPQVADVLLQDFLLIKPGGRKVVWLSEEYVLLCEGSQPSDKMPPHVDMPRHNLCVESNDSRLYFLTLIREEVVGSDFWYREADDDYDDEDEDAMHLLHKVVALGTGIRKVDMRFRGESLPTTVPGIHDFLSLARSRRTLQFNSGVSPEFGRILAYHCRSPMVELEVTVFDWEDGGEVLAEAMLANRGPKRLALACFGGVVSSALAATRCVEELTVRLPLNDADAWRAVARNRDIRALGAGFIGIVSYRDVKGFWKAALTHRAIQRIDATEVADELHGARFHRDRIECTEMIATMIRSNPRITDIQYDPLAYSVRIMETRVMPIVHLNRFRPMVKAKFAGGALSSSSVDPQKELSALIGSPLVRRHPELLYCLLQAGRDHLLLPPTDAGTSHERASERPAPRKRSRGGD